MMKLWSVKVHQPFDSLPHVWRTPIPLSIVKTILGLHGFFWATQIISYPLNPALPHPANNSFFYLQYLKNDTSCAIISKLLYILDSIYMILSINLLFYVYIYILLVRGIDPL